MAGRLLFIDAPTGIAGDMFLAALADLGLPLAELESAFHRAGLADLGLRVEEVKSGGLRGLRLQVTCAETPRHRGLDDCLALIGRLGLEPATAARAGRLFERLAEVEARLHASTPARIHFHELGAVDSLVDIVGAAWGLERLQVEAVYLRDLGLGAGCVDSAHGRLPLPAPATLELLRGLPVRETGIEAETVTPTGALILAETARPAPPGLSWLPLRAGYGAGSRELPGMPNLLRLTLAEATGASDPAPAGCRRRILPVLRCAIDDMSPEHAGYLMEKLLAAGALDVHFSPLQMKKSRPGIAVELLGEEDKLEVLAAILFEESSTLGLRISREERWELPRESETVSTPYGSLRMKVASLPSGRRRAAPEYEDCARLARASGLPLAEIEEAARAAWREREAQR